MRQIPDINGNTHPALESHELIFLSEIVAAFRSRSCNDPRALGSFLADMYLNSASPVNPDIAQIKTSLENIELRLKTLTATDLEEIKVAITDIQGRLNATIPNFGKF